VSGASYVPKSLTCDLVMERPARVVSLGSVVVEVRRVSNDELKLDAEKYPAEA
jgi:hypothetical protein